MFTVKEARPGDALKGIARMNPADMDVLSLSEGQIIEIVGKKVTAARVRGAKRTARSTCCRSTTDRKSVV